MGPDQATTTADEGSTATVTDQHAAATAGRETETTVTVRCTGHVRTALGRHELEFTFEGTRLRDFLEAFFAEYDLADMLIAETEADATHSGWAPVPDDLPGTWRKNPEGEQTRPYARVCVNGRFNEHLDGFETELADDDRVALLYPFLFCC
ncbi:MoaD/ThiS family protein [Natrinema pallidum]|uniref:MoaD/ThiS family protein n=1 Tax=Natrinema pallidum TaxID=69527 RepID=A0A4P9TIJ0_9EURY|nr:MoaD/ThiS family protein [Natrinema pallidum]QCW03782.1 MoaD/ThiS family protein [Natrinema pallidum]